MDGFQGVYVTAISQFLELVREKGTFPRAELRRLTEPLVDQVGNRFQSFLLVWTVCLYGQCGAFTAANIISDRILLPSTFFS